MNSGEQGDRDTQFTTVVDLGRMLRSRLMSAVEVARATLDRLDTDGRVLNAVAGLTYDRALAEAKQADLRLARGAARVLDGIPYAVKDLIAVRGTQTGFGSRISVGAPAEDDAECVRRLTRRGAILTAKLGLLELAGVATRRADSSATGPGRNPWRADHWSGGSSSGSASAVGAGLIPFALASETAGSIVSPAAYCGVTAIRPTYGLVSRVGVLPLSWTLDKVGVMARSAGDIALVIDALAGRDRISGGQKPKIATSEMRIGMCEEDFEETADDGVRPALREGLHALREVTGAWHRSRLPSDVPYLATTLTIIDGEAGAALGAYDVENGHAGLIDPEQAASLTEMRAEVRAMDYLAAQRIRRRVIDATTEMFETVDVIVSYGMPHTAPPLTSPIPSAPHTVGNAALGLAGNLAGLPAVSVPCGVANDGLPVGLQLVGPPFSDRRLLEVAAALQSMTVWHQLRPPKLA